jgi:hypothetical protein
MPSAASAVHTMNWIMPVEFSDHVGSISASLSPSKVSNHVIVTRELKLDIPMPRSLLSHGFYNCSVFEENDSAVTGGMLVHFLRKELDGTLVIESFEKTGLGNIPEPVVLLSKDDNGASALDVERGRGVFNSLHDKKLKFLVRDSRDFRDAIVTTARLDSVEECF